MAFRTSTEFDSLAEINITPLVDVMLVLLIIFIVTSPMLVQGLQVELPRQAASPIPRRPPSRSSHADPGPRRAARDQPVHPKLLAQRLGPMLAGGPRPVYLKGDQQLPYGFIVEIPRDVNRMGVEEIGMITAPPEKE